ncbi:MAG TPA: adenylosuccinate synthase [Dehalococcoidia bacterium]|nr:adenylosuccinate synthase [Dehalococcoidia bacterium]
MPVVALVGGQWGDEGKGKVIDSLSAQADMVVRYAGGDNAGHTTVNPLGTFKLHLVPSGIFHADVTCIIGNGVVVNPAVLLKEIAELRSHGLTVQNLCLSDRAHLIMPYHMLLDELEEERRGSNAIGTTRRGIGPAFVDKVARTGIRVGDLMDPEGFRARLNVVMEQKNILLASMYRHEPLSIEGVFEQYLEYGNQIRQYVCDTLPLIHEARERGDLILLEGAQGTLLDTDFGSYPFVTSSSPLSGGATTGSGLGPTHIDRVIGVYKAYTTRVGGGPMPTELHDETGSLIREKAGEYGATTGRPRRCGWFDAVAGRLSVLVNGMTEVALTHLDIFDGFESIKVCTAYRVDGELINTFPSRVELLARCEPVYKEFPGWSECTEDVTDFAQLPANAQQYVRHVGQLLGCRVSLLSMGPKREQMFEVKP